ncbi:MAG: DUF1326 domain-containing protein [Planctomycetaceae bacterium]|jgi:hypothetical protein|nr:DUF1326 domain-containing protein [Planctomycetaceae bacterium]
MRHLSLATAAGLLFVFATTGHAAKITGEYVEARTCSVYTGPCFANAEMGLAGKEALMAWKIDKGEWKGINLDGIGAAVIVTAESTIGYDGVFPLAAGKMKSVILVDSKASSEQFAAMVEFVKDTAKTYTKHVVRVERAPIQLKNNHLKKQAIFSAGKIAEIKTRALTLADCVCTNEVVYYQPLVKVENFSPAFSLKMSFQGKGLGRRFTNFSTRSAFLATFRR